MKYHTLQLPEDIYQRLLRQAQASELTPVEALQQLLTGYSALSEGMEAQAAAERLTTLFADVRFADFDALADDPAISLANFALGDLSS